MNIESLYHLFLQFKSVQTDTRKLKSNDIFFALKGNNFNGNSFAKNALDDGASYVIIDEEQYLIDNRTILVDNVLETLQNLAKYHRKQFKIPFIAITGSNGKTTTKELVSSVLSTSFITYTTQGNLNNHIGIPLTLLSVREDAQIAVIEMGANHQKEIEGYCKYVLPTHAIITNCGKAHLEGFGGVEGVRKGKGELYDFIRSNGGTLFLNTDYDYLKDMSKGIDNIFTYGTNMTAQINGRAIQAEPFLEVAIQLNSDLGFIKTNLVGDYNLPNVLCAVAVGNYFRIPFNTIKNAIENYHPTNSRSQLLNLGSNAIILDAYNANPNSMLAAIENFIQLNAPFKILMIGGMKELGAESIHEHEKIIEAIQKYSHWEEVVLVGSDFDKVSHPFKYFKTSSEARIWFQHQQFQHAHILIKGSRSIAMEKILE